MRSVTSGNGVKTGVDRWAAVCAFAGDGWRRATLGRE